jgi:hypothetical protein
MNDSAYTCLAQLREMDNALERMEHELPDDVRPIGAAARNRVARCMTRLLLEGVQPDELTGTLQEISRMMDALTEHLLLAAWDPPRTLLRN